MTTTAIPTWCACRYSVLYPNACCYCELVPDCGKMAIKDDKCRNHVEGVGKIRTMESMVVEGCFAMGHEEIKVRMTKTIIKPVKSVKSKRIKGQGSLL
jgi:hypothetical protein